MPPRAKPKAKAKIVERPLLQWIMAAFGGGVTLAVIGVVAWEAVQPQSPPSLEARIVAVRQVAGGYVAEVEVANDGTNTAAAVDLIGVVGEAPPSTATIDYVPGRGHATAYLLFRSDPRAAEVKVAGWSEP